MASEQQIRNAAVVWLKNNTTVELKDEPYPDNVELFIEKYSEVMKLRAGVSSESISGLSQSFNISDIGVSLKQYARELLGEQFVLSDVKVFPTLEKWTY